VLQLQHEGSEHRTANKSTQLPTMTMKTTNKNTVAIKHQHMQVKRHAQTHLAEYYSTDSDERLVDG